MAMKFAATLLRVLAFALSSCEGPIDPACKGEARLDCVCPQNYAPVCGCDEVTYVNSCYAECAGVKSWTQGECGN